MKESSVWKGKAIKTILIHTNVQAIVYTIKLKIYKKAGKVHMHNIHYAPFVKHL